MARPPDERFDKYATWVDRRRRVIVAVGALVALVGLALALRLPIHADWSNLLPPGERSVRDLDQIQSRTSSLGLVLCAVESDDPALRARAAHRLAERLRAVDNSLIANVVVDDGLARRFAWDHRFLVASLPDLEEARDAIKSRIARANPLYVSLDENGDAEAQAAFDRLRTRLRAAEKKVASPDEIVSGDGRVQLVIVEAPFPSASVTQGERLVATLGPILEDVRREVGPGVALGMTEDIVIGVAEHRAVLEGMSLAILLTVTIVGLSLFFYYRSWPALLALFGSLGVGTLATFGVTRLAIGSLNSVSAFLSSIVVGNGINFGILVVARHLEERRAGRVGTGALAVALRGSFAGTVTAALAASVAYGSLVVTDFRGFRDFGVIGGVGMVLCWTSAYTVLPALLATLERRGLVRARPEPRLGPLLGRLLPRRPETVLVGAGALALAAALVTGRFLAGDPLEYDWQRMRSDGGLAREARRWMATIDAAFGRQLVGGFVVGLGTPEEARAVERTLKQRAEDEPGVDASKALFRKVGSIDDYVPADQDQKLATLGEIRKLFDRHAEALTEDLGAAEVRRLRPPDDLQALTVADVPEMLARRFVERDGRVGRLLFANQASRFDGWNGRHMIAFAKSVRALDLPPSTAIGGGAFVFADILDAVVRAGPRATLVAIAGVVLFVLVILGPSRHALVTLVCLAEGTALMIASAALMGLKVNFLDFAALPITLGIGVDYAVNVATRERTEGPGSARHALVTTGGVVALCSWTTIVGYGSLLLSANAGIRSFGLTAILGEATCLATALTLAPALLTVLGRRAAVAAEHSEAA
ncbi:MAG TPA: MMPL family transporter [Polyangia bacterium]|nr:MMPL family transporter [Polyangia bacterium]